MKNDVTLLTGSLDITKTVEEINKAIKKIEKHPKLRKVKLIIDNNPSKSIQSIAASFHKLNQESNEHSRMLKNLTSQYKSLELGKIVTTASAAALAAFQDQLQSAEKKTNLWSTALERLKTPLRLLQITANTIIEVDKQMTQLKLVMNESTDFDSLLAKNINSAKELGRSITDLNAATSSFAKKGYSEQDALELAKTSVVTQNISDLTPDESVQILTTAMSAFNIEASKGITIIDKLADVDNRYHVTTSDLADALNKAAYTAKSYGVSLDDLIGHSTTIMTVTHETGAAVGDSIRTIYSNLMSSSDAAAELSNIGISFKESSGQAKTASAILEELSAKWSSLSAATQQNIAVTLAGKDELKSFLALMNNYETALDATESSLHSRGAAIKQNGIYMQSLEARINTMKTAWEELALKMGDAVITDSLIQLISAASALGDVFSWLTEHFGVLPIVLGTTAAALHMLNAGFKSFIATNAITIAGLFGVAPAAAAASTGVRGLSAAINSLKIGLKGLAASTGIGLLFAAAGTVLEWFINKTSDTKDSMDGLNDSFERAAQKSSDFDHLKALSQQYEELARSENLNAQEKNKLASIENELQTKFGLTIKSIDGQSGAYASNNELIQQRISLLDKEIKAEREKAELEYRQDKKNIDKDVADKAAKKESAEKRYNNAEQNYLNILNKVENNEPIELKYSRKTGVRIDKTLDPQKDKAEIQSYVEELAKAFNEAREYYVDTSTEFDQAFQKVEQANKASFARHIDNLEQEGKKVGDTTRSLFDALAAVSAEKNYEFTKEELTRIFDVFNSTNPDNIDKLKDSFLELPHPIELTSKELGLFEQIVKQVSFSTITNQQKELDAASRDLQQTVNSTENELKYLNQTLYDLERGQKLSAEAVTDLLKKYPELAGEVSKMGDGWTIEESAVESVRQKKLDLLRDSLMAERGITGTLHTELQSRLRNYGIELSSIKDLATARLEAANIPTIDIPSNIYNHLPEHAKQIFEEKNRQAEKTKEDLINYGKNLETINDLEQTMKDRLFGVKNSSSSGSSSSSKDKAAYESRLKINKLEDAVTKANAALDKNQQKLDEAIASGKDYDKVLNNRLTLYNNLTKSLDHLKNSHVKQQQELRGILGKAGLLDKNGAVIENAGQKLESIANSGTETIQGHSIQTIESFVEQYLNLPQQINDTDSKLNQAVMGIVDTFGKGLERIQSASETKQVKSKHKIAMLGEINTTEEKELLATYTEEIVQNIVNERKQINDEIYKTQQLIRSDKSTDAQKRAAEIYLKTLLDAQNNKYEEVVTQSEDLGKKQADALISGFEDQMKELEFQKSLLGSLDTPEKQQAATDIDKAIASVYAQAAQSIESQTAELTQKLNTSQLIEEKSRAQAKLDALNEYQRTVLKQIADMNNAEAKARSDRADSIIENYKKMLQKEKELREQAIEEEIRGENERHNNKVKHLDDELKRYEDIINARLKSLDRANAEEDYEAQLNKLMKERQDIADKISVLALDNSFEAKAKRKALQEQLDSKNEEIDKFKLDRERELVKEGLSDQLEDRRKTIEKERELEDKQHEDALDKLDEEKRKIERHYKQILEDEKYFYDQKQSLLNEDKAAVNTALNEIQLNYDSFFAYLEEQSKRFGSKIADNIRYGFEQDYTDTQEYRDTIDSSGKAPSGSSTVPGQASGGKQNEDAEKQRRWKEYLANKQRAESLTRQAIQLQRTDPNSIDIIHIKEEIDKLRSINDSYRKLYNFPDKSYDELKNMKPFSAKSGGMTPPWGGNGGKFLLAHEKEIVLNQSDSFNLLKVVDITRNIVDSIRNMKLPSFTQQQNTTHAGTTIQNLHVAITGAFGPKDGGDMAASLINGLKARGVNI
ncbi:phage tail tape measure protein [Paenibacillus apiarius]|uniref:phage tail tape measure protein n=1 Tax=Paenibacillus apiarius TaxID=46240 RepID=UPI003B3B93E6